MDDQQPLTYRDAGVDIDAGDELVRRIKPAVETTQRPEVLGGLGGFGGLIEIPAGYRRPVLVAGTDGVGTKLRLAAEAGRHRGLGIDLVAMCVNDVVVQGAEPLLFLDYYATGRLDVEAAAALVDGVADGCRQAGAALLGGETAEMPGLYAPGDYDVAGFCVGVVEHDRIIDGRHATPGDVLIALPSTGPHSNGYSLIRKILERHREDKPGGPEAAPMVGGAPLLDALLAPTRIYVRAALALAAAVPVKAFAHITGGGLPENLPRVLPDPCAAELDPWPWPAVFQWLAEGGRVEEGEMLRTFNCGVGFVACVAPEHAARAVALLKEHGEDAWEIGRLVPAGDGERRVRFPQGAQK